ncbi:Uncharacterised protein [Bacteroides heparinolyticus]|uniref:Uncharacterized protein n=1 Tax=Prevotella heparinolytica TaxID=28113 RepID=A0A449I3F1_9BACE|nr:Uncharacterised protein [Bacteroides heparinolyticus]
MNYLFIMKRVFNWLLISLCTCFSEWKKKSLGDNHVQVVYFYPK